MVTYESPSRFGPRSCYTTKSEVTLQRPDKLRVITSGDGPASEFYYNGKTMTAFAPAENLVAVADAPPTIDDALTTPTTLPRSTSRSPLMMSPIPTRTSPTG